MLKKKKVLCVVGGFHKKNLRIILAGTSTKCCWTSTMFSSFIKMSRDKNVVGSVLNHNHEKLELNILIDKISNNVKWKAQDIACEKP